ncbi:MAG: TVP38/TMEM64 family protein [Romboutsia sp.]|uniref:TVP38/TMEM64 family protein n=1 Tax=Romboutsia sp. TaxID=1965302 RepID=UPI003F4000C8
MEYIQEIFSLIQDNQLLVFVIAILATFIESFIPALPLIGIVMLNGAMLGFVGGIVASCIGSCLGTALLFIISKKFGSIKYFDKFKESKFSSVVSWVKKQNGFVYILCYSCPFIPGCLVSIASGFCNKELKYFVPNMVIGKSILFIISSYIGDNMIGFFNSPVKMISVGLLVVISFIIGKKLNSTMEKYEISNDVIYE